MHTLVTVGSLPTSSTRARVLVLPIDARGSVLAWIGGTLVDVWKSICFSYSHDSYDYLITTCIILPNQYVFWSICEIRPWTIYPAYDYLCYTYIIPTCLEIIMRFKIEVKFVNLKLIQLLLVGKYYILRKIKVSCLSNYELNVSIHLVISVITV